MRIRRLWMAALLVNAAGSFPALANGTGSGDGYGHMWGGSWYGMVFGPLVMIAVIAAVVAVVVLLVRWLGGPGYGTGAHPPPSAGESAMDILSQRFARGEIDAEEFQERKRLLED